MFNKAPLKHRIKLYKKIYKRNPHLWDKNEYDIAKNWPYEALELKRNPKLLVFLKDYRVVEEKIFYRHVFDPIENIKNEKEDMQIVWDFYGRCLRKVNQVKFEWHDPEKLKELMRIIKSAGL